MCNLNSNEAVIKSAIVGDLTDIIVEYNSSADDQDLEKDKLGGILEGTKELDADTTESYVDSLLELLEPDVEDSETPIFDVVNHKMSLPNGNLPTTITKSVDAIIHTSIIEYIKSIDILLGTPLDGDNRYSNPEIGFNLDKNKISFLGSCGPNSFGTAFFLEGGDSAWTYDYFEFEQEEDFFYLENSIVFNMTNDFGKLKLTVSLALPQGVPGYDLPDVAFTSLFDEKQSGVPQCIYDMYHYVVTFSNLSKDELFCFFGFMTSAYTLRDFIINPRTSLKYDLANQANLT